VRGHEEAESFLHGKLKTSNALGVMKTFHHLPHPLLRPYIARIWGWESLPGELIALPTLLPGTGAELYLHTGQPFMAGGSDSARRGELFCLRRRCIALGEARNIGFIAIRFRIGMLARFTDLPAPELLDGRLAVDALWGGAGARLLQRLAETGEQGRRLQLVEAFLLERLRDRSPDLLIEQALNLLYRNGASLTIERLAELSGLGRRQLEKRWLRATGVSPSEMRGLCRFHHTVRALMLNSGADPTDTALANGYYDQAHFSHDFRSRTGHPPLAYLQAARKRTHFYNTPDSATAMLLTPQHQRSPYVCINGRTRGCS
jgi:AraC-like DNA-binding protein